MTFLRQVIHPHLLGLLGVGVAIALHLFSPAFSAPPPRVPLNTTQLQTLLQAQNWQAADLETRSLLESRSRSYSFLYESGKSIQTVPCEDLRTLDQLWTRASRGRFGFTAQRRLWTSLQAKIRNSKVLVDRFGQTVGWRSSGAKPLQPMPAEFSEFDRDFFLKADWQSDYEINFSLQAPVGHLPWSGMASDRLLAMLKESGAGCGSCTVDAMYLQGDRFYTYLPGLFNRLKTCKIPA